MSTPIQTSKEALDILTTNILFSIIKSGGKVPNAIFGFSLLHKKWLMIIEPVIKNNKPKIYELANQDVVLEAVKDYEDYVDKQLTMKVKK